MVADSGVLAVGVVLSVGAFPSNAVVGERILVVGKVVTTADRVSDHPDAPCVALERPCFPSGDGR